MKSSGLADLTEELAEIPIDLFLKNEIIKEIPIIKDIHAIIKTGIGIRDYLFLKKLLKFLSSFNSLSEEERHKLVEKLERDESYGRKVGEHLIEVLDRIEGDRKPEILGKIFLAYAKELIDVMMLKRLVLAIERLPIHEIESVRKYFALSPEERLEFDKISLQIFSNAGLVNVISGYGALVYEPNEVLEKFVELNFDK